MATPPQNSKELAVGNPWLDVYRVARIESMKQTDTQRGLSLGTDESTCFRRGRTTGPLQPVVRTGAPPREEELAA